MSVVRPHSWRFEAWLAARRYGVPAEMVERVTRLRLAGDWRAALAAAGFELRSPLADVRREFGSEVAAALEDDLAHLVPDLVRWYLPRDSGGASVLQAGQGALLAEYGDDIGLTAVADSPGFGPQLVHLWCRRGTNRASDRNWGWTQTRYMWDRRATHLLLHRAGGGDRTPFFERDGRPHVPAESASDPVSRTERILALQDAGEVLRAWEVAGIQVDDGFADPYPPSSDRTERPLPWAAAAMLPALVPIVHARLDALRPGARVELRRLGEAIVVLSRTDGVLHARLDHDMYRRGPSIPVALWRRIPDLELLRAGLITATDLHPLVRSALFPEQPDPGYRPRGGPGPAGSTVEESARVEVAVRCREQEHRLAFRGGRLVALDHPAEQALREQAMAALGGPVPACFTVLDAWRGGPPDGPPPRLPTELQVLRQHGVAVLRHGDTAELLRLLDAGIDPTGFLDVKSRGALHYLATVDGEAVLGRLLAAGLDINAPDEDGFPPLARALLGHGPPSLIRAMLDAGADPLAVVSADGEPVVRGLPRWALTPMVIEAAHAAASA